MQFLRKLNSSVDVKESISWYILHIKKTSAVALATGGQVNCETVDPVKGSFCECKRCPLSPLDGQCGVGPVPPRLTCPDEGRFF